MPLHLTKIAFRSESPATLRAWLESHADLGEAHLTTRYLPKRHEEVAGGSLYWILGGAIVGRSPILGFADAPDSRVWIRLAPRLVPVRSIPRRAHQGWRYLEGEDAPPDLGGDDSGLDALPSKMMGALTKLGLV